MMKHMETLLRSAGVAPLSEDLEASMEAWLGLRTVAGDDSAAPMDTSAASNNNLSDYTVEDSLPLSPSVYEAAVDWLVDAWQNPSTFLGPTGNPLLEYKQLQQNDAVLPTLYKAYGAVRATVWLHTWMEFNLSTDVEYLSIVAKLLQVDQRDPSSKNSAVANESSDGYFKVSPKNALLRALFQHIQELPNIQQHVYSFSQQLQRADPHSMVTNSNVSARLLQYERAMEISNALQAEFQKHVDQLEVIVTEFYRFGSAEQRKLARRLLGHVWGQFVLLSESNSFSLRQENTRAAAIRMTLLVLRRILLGAKLSNTKTDNNNDKTHPLLPATIQHLLFHQLIPLHQPDGIVLWRDQSPILELYHEPLCQCIGIILQHHPDQIPSVITQILQPNVLPLAGHTSKQVLILHEIETYLRLIKTEPNSLLEKDEDYMQQLRTMMQHLYRGLSRCVSSEHSRVAEQALQFFQNKIFENLVVKYLEMGLHILLPALVRKEPSWNPTVRKMTYNVLKRLQELDGRLFEEVSNAMFPHLGDVRGSTEEKTTSNGISRIVQEQTEASAATRNMTTATSDFSLKAGMGTWKPPSTSSRRIAGSMPPPSARPPSHKLPSSTNPPGKGSAPWASTSSAPPLTVTGVAPWAMQRPSANPPLEVTGVAPWAIRQGEQNVGSLSHKRGADRVQLPEVSESMDENDGNMCNMSGLGHVLKFMEKIKPAHEEEGISSWSIAQMAESPTYLPDLKFHDLVFGHELGRGSFGSVKYARLIDKKKPRSQWPEYAVKVISTEKIRELGYEFSAQREITVLRILSHPGIARLISSFRFREGAYLVLEYASRGDLHTLLQKHGSLDVDSTRFVIGEVVAALASIHDMGLVYVDLKPENIVITEPGHIKLTDFGGCRPASMTSEQAKLISAMAKNVFRELRDGGWKQNPTCHTLGNDGDTHCSTNVSAMEENVIEEGNSDSSISQEEDLRIEGTTAYLPPEVVMGAFPTTATDSWALGCVMYQCFTGRPPILEADDEATKHRIVSFDAANATTGNEVDRLFQDKHASGINPEAQDLIRCLLDREPTKRPRMNEMAEHSFFPFNIFELYTKPAYPLDVGNVAPSPDARWSRRQFSSIWAPQPEAYNLSFPDSPVPGKNGTFPNASSQDLITEGEEYIAFFSPSGTSSTSAGASSGKRADRSKLLPPS